MQMIHAPHAFDTEREASKPKVFLAGSIEMDTAERWQDGIAEEFSAYDIVLLNPRRPVWDSGIEQSIHNPVFKEQVEWEQRGLKEADVILFYFDPKTKSPISLLELGLFAASGKVFVCCPEGFWRKGNVDIIAKQYGIPIFELLPECIKAVERCIKEKLIHTP
ncbi:MAG: hypothetical protein JWN50_502 [Parcubacteria group bacterium]|nr:hypothetical protein [Parcubacteria group bacterium]